MQDSGAPKKRKESDPFGRPTGGLGAIFAFVRGIPDRLRRPESLLMLMAILASLGAHMPPWVGLGALADYFERAEHEREAQKPVEVSFEVTPPPDAPEPPKVEPAPEPEKPLPKEKEKRKPEPKLAAAEPPPEPKPELKVSQLELPKPETAPPPPPAQTRKQSITQKSDDPNVEPPPEAEYLAEENRRVEEQTVARVTSETKNDDELQEAAPEAPGPEESGDSLEDDKGQEKGADTPEQLAVVPRSSAATPPAVREPRPSVSKQAEREEIPEEPMVVRDPMGTFVMAPSRPAQKGQRGREGREGQTAAPANLKVSWRAFEQTFGEEQLAQDRMPREAKRRGAGREKRWSEFRAAIENYITGVKPGNTTALNAAADPFAAYLAAFHRNLHGEFAHEFIGSLPISGALGDMNLVAKVEIVVNPDGTLDRVGVVKSSGNLMYDFGAFNAVQRGAPYPPPPEKIRSPDGRTYLRWALHRDQSQCGTWNAEPFILKTPPRSPNDPKQDNVSPYLPGGGDQEHGHRVPAEPGNGKQHSPGGGPAVRPGDTLGELLRKRRSRLG